MTETLTMSSLYDKLSKLGLNPDYVRNNGLPSWWNDELNDKPVAVLEGAAYIADNLNLDLESLLAEQKIRFNTPPVTKFKQHNSQNNNHPHVAQALASRVAELIAYGTEVNFTPLPTDVKEIRTEILTNHKKVNLISLLEYVWSKGIVVGYFHNFPDKSRKFAGLIQWQFSCPVIILSSKPTHSSRLAFNLAHELGHLALGHLKEGILVDEKIEFNCNDNDELQANNFAARLLLNDCDNCLRNKNIYNNAQLTQQANIKAKQNPTVEADSIVLNYGWHTKNWGRVTKALETLDPLVNGQKIINEYLAKKLDWDKFNDESYEYLEKVLGV
ncbi:ImmA/IrrE family metallo-endopeptidase [Dolichospermum circinale]|uniref:ImmA/IrrE family metallo-endopeptidase n=1 Tax=Dolichospermum circinale TaxID=109265 RepID=UPI00233076AB|nr:ImmA/IrrE family metallo-endopeptidase [Dolichospermum circinale]MDB9450938.1 ImmA/IrrE family metallo-endopeptidase [Dolichospermum circinale CS-547]